MTRNERQLRYAKKNGLYSSNHRHSLTESGNLNSQDYEKIGAWQNGELE